MAKDKDTCSECEHSGWCIYEQARRPESDPEHPFNWCRELGKTKKKEK
jgi:hypothetical protein